MLNTAPLRRSRLFTHVFVPICPLNAAVIPLTKGYWAIVDSADYHLVSQYVWTAAVRGRLVYAKTHINRKLTYLHNFLLESSPAKGFVTDHRNENGLDNRRKNLRRCPHNLNLVRSRIVRSRRTGYLGVVPHGPSFSARIGKSYIGVFPTPEEAARAYDAEATKRYGEFAKLNFNPNPMSGIVSAIGGSIE